MQVIQIVADVSDGCVVIQMNLDRLEKWANRSCITGEANAQSSPWE